MDTKKILKIVGLIVGCFVIVLVAGMLYMTRGLTETSAMIIHEVDLSQVPDGKYSGEFTGNRWSNKVEVTVSNHTISNIEMLENQTFHMGDEIDKLLERVVAEQSLNVDMISGGTVSSKAVLKAVEDALTQR